MTIGYGRVSQDGNPDEFECIDGWPSEVVSLPAAGGTFSGAAVHRHPPKSPKQGMFSVWKVAFCVGMTSRQGLRLFLGTLQRGLRQLMVSEVSYSGSAEAPTRNLVI